MNGSNVTAPRRRDVLAVGASILAAGAPLLATTLPAAATSAFAWPTLSLLDGSRLAPHDWIDVAAVVVIFASWCPFCKRHNVHVEQLHRAHAGRHLRVIAASIEPDPGPVRRYIAAQGYTFPVTMQGNELRALLNGRKVIPLTAGIDRAGRPGVPIAGEMFEEDVMELASLARPVARPGR